MERDVLIALINNAALLLVLSVVYEISYVVSEKYRNFKFVLSGSLIALICIAIMSVPFNLQEGIFFDTRSILISVTALIFGPIPTLISGLAASIYRLLIGGSGAIPGVAVIFCSAGIGLAWRRWLYPVSKKTRWFSIYIMSLVVHITMLLCMMLLPAPDNLIVIRTIAAPVMVIYPIAAMLLSLFLLRQLELRETQDLMKKSEDKYKLLFETMSQGVVYQSADGSIISMNPAAERILGLTFDQAQGRTSMDPNWRAIREDGTEMNGSEHPTMIALRTGKAYGPLVMGIFQPQSKDYVWLSVNATPLFRLSEATPYQVYSTFQDITAERKANQDYLQLFREMVGAFALHEIICDESGRPIDYRFLAVNPAFERLTGLRAEDLLGHTVLEVLPDTETYWIEMYGKVALTGENVSFHQYSSSLDRHFAVTAYRSAPNQFATTFWDITDRILAENALKESQAKYSGYIENAPYGVFVVNEAGQYVELNTQALSFTGYSQEQLLNMTIKDITPPSSLGAALRHFDGLRASGKMNAELEYIHGNGLIRWWSVNAVKLSETRYLGFSTDITERKQMEARLRYMTEHDMLTDLHNRDYLENLLINDALKQDGRNRALVGVNLSTVQLLTTNYGFQYTQNLMKLAAETLKEFVNESRFLFHVNENQFVFYLTDYHSRDDLLLFGEGLTKVLESVFVTDRVGGGLGILELNAQEAVIDVDSLLRRLFLASERAIDIFERDYGVRFYDEELDAVVSREGTIRRALSAVVADAPGSELFLQYQPIMDLRSNTTVGFEALARLRTNEFGIVSPLEFIPIAEETKMIIPMGEKIIRDALEFLHKLNANGFDTIEISINISAIQLLSPNFTERLFQICEESQVQFKNVGIEITESIFASDYEKINGIIEQLREAGLHIAIDDFGTGYSSLAREKELNVDSMKIDKYFIDQLLEPNRKKVITSDIISMAHKLGQITIAEGVEVESQLNYLREHHCDRVQGYLISRPMDEGAAMKYLKDRSASKN